MHWGAVNMILAFYKNKILLLCLLLLLVVVVVVVVVVYNQDVIHQCLICLTTTTKSKIKSQALRLSQMKQLAVLMSVQLLVSLR